MNAEPTLVPRDETLGALLGFETVEMTAERATARFEVRNCHRQPFGLVHGGVYAALAEGLASEATARVVVPEGYSAQGMANNINFLRPIFDGTVHAHARRRHRGRTSWVWDVDILDDQDRLCATMRLTIAVRPMDDRMKWELGLIARSDS